MTHIRVTEAVGPFIRGSRGLCVRESEEAVWMKGKNMRCDLQEMMQDVVYGPIPKEFIEEYVPDQPEKTLDEKIKAIWPPKK